MAYNSCQSKPQFPMQKGVQYLDVAFGVSVAEPRIIQANEARELNLGASRGNDRSSFVYENSSGHDQIDDR